MIVSHPIHKYVTSSFDTVLLHMIRIKQAIIFNIEHETVHVGLVHLLDTPSCAVCAGWVVLESRLT
jgi:hypothetical protein